MVKCPHLCPESTPRLLDDDDSTTWHVVSSDEEEDDEDEDLLLPFLDPTTLNQALDVTNDCVVVTEPTHPYAITHANAGRYSTIQYLQACIIIGNAY